MQFRKIKTPKRQTFKRYSLLVTLYDHTSTSTNNNPDIHATIFIFFSFFVHFRPPRKYLLDFVCSQFGSQSDIIEIHYLLKIRFQFYLFTNNLSIIILLKTIANRVQVFCRHLIKTLYIYHTTRVSLISGKYRPPSPRQPTPPPKIIERQPQYIRTVARPISYGQL